MKRGCLISIALTMALLWSATRGCAPGGSGDITALRIEGVGDFKITQRWTGWIEPYVVRFRFLPTGEDRWHYHLIDFESQRWFGARLEYDSGRGIVSVWRGDVLEGEYDIGEGLYAHYYSWAGESRRGVKTWPLEVAPARK